MAGVVRFLFVRDAPTGDQMDLCARMSMHDRPDSIEWGDWMKLTRADTGKSIVCRLRGEDESVGSVQLKRIHINSHLRRMLGLELDKAATYRLQEFNIEKAPSWAFFWYIYRYHPNRRRRADVFAWTVLIGGITIGLIGVTLLFTLR